MKYRVNRLVGDPLEVEADGFDPTEVGVMFYCKAADGFPTFLEEGVEPVAFVPLSQILDIVRVEEGRPGIYRREVPAGMFAEVGPVVIPPDPSLAEPESPQW